jgi:predicted MFS family arabinose efflux permease
MAAPPRLDRRVSFWLLGLLLVLLLSAASAPSPLYGVYQGLWHFPAITLTAVYASYALGGLVALLMTGRLPDHLGRRVVLAAGLVVEALAMLVFVLAGDVTALFIGRVLAGAGIGIAAGAVSAWLLDLSPPSDPGLGSLVGGAAPLLGLGTGALLGGALVEYGPDPLHLVFWLLAVAYAVGAVVIAAIPDPVLRRPGWFVSMRPTVDVPAAARPIFVAGLPAVIAMWALAGLYLSLGPSLASQLLATDNRAAGGLVIFALAGTGAVTAAVVRSGEPSRLLVRGSALVIAGVSITLVGQLLSSVALLYGGTVVAGVGLGAGFSAYVRATAPLVAPERRGALVAAIYAAVYVSFSVPTVLAGAAVTAIGLAPTAYGYGAIVIVLAAITTVAVSRRLDTRRVATLPTSR